MIKLFSLKQQKKDEVPGRASNQKKASAAQLRITKGMFHKTIATSFFSPSHHMFINSTLRYQRVESTENVSNGIS